MEPLVNNIQLLKLLGISRSTLLRLLDRGLPHYAEGKLRRFNLDEVLRWYGAEMEQDTPSLTSPPQY